MTRQLNLTLWNPPKIWSYDHAYIFFWGGVCFWKMGHFFGNFLIPNRFKWSQKRTRTALRAASKYAKIVQERFFWWSLLVWEILEIFPQKPSFYVSTPLWVRNFFCDEMCQIVRRYPVEMRQNSKDIGKSRVFKKVTVSECFWKTWFLGDFGVIFGTYGF